MSRLVLLSALLAMVAGTPGGAASATGRSTWTLRDLGALGGQTSEATAINNRGQVVGWSTTSGGARHAFLWERGRIRDLGTLGGRQSEALGLNERGQIVGWSTTTAGRRHAFLWERGRMRDLGAPTGPALGSTATGINERGQISGWSGSGRSPIAGKGCGPDTAGSCRLGFVWEKGFFTGLGAFSQAGWSAAYGLNDDMLLAGASGRAMTWMFWDRQEHPSWFGPLAGLAGAALAVNERGAAVGWTTFKAVRRAFLWKHRLDGAPLVIGTLGGTTSTAFGIDRQSRVVGQSATGRSAVHAFAWQSGTMHDLGALPGHRDSRARGINDRGQIVGTSGTSDPDGPRFNHQHAVLWTPT